ncbi:MAG: hypothetical protein K0Q49_691 [Haloplasmataceae bacterium]|jgi:hypothetical protein|nr:hypothetical protein [Haloplasmataceae bacterium]
MRKYNKKILTALVVAYKKGIINRKPLNRWLNIDKIFNRIIKYLCYLVLYLFLFLIFDSKAFIYFKMDETVIISGYIIEKSKIVSGFVLGIMALNFYKLIVYLNQVFIVKKAMKIYNGEEFNIEQLNNITYKIHV